MESKGCTNILRISMCIVAKAIQYILCNVNKYTLLMYHKMVFREGEPRKGVHWRDNVENCI